MQVLRAVITAAGPKQNRLPLQQFVDVDGGEKSALQIIIEEVVAAGVEEIGLVIRPGDEPLYQESAGEHAGRLTMITQPEPRGYGEALHRAASFVAERPFLHLVSDHLYVSDEPRRCAEQLVREAEQLDASVSAVQATHESMLPHYGTVGGKLVAGRTSLYEVEEVVEKPTPTEAEQRLCVPGLRASHYLCVFGMHVLTPTVMDVLAEQIERSQQATIQLSPALNELTRRERYCAKILNGTRHNIGLKYGNLLAQLGLTLAGDDREQILTQMVELFARRCSRVG